MGAISLNGVSGKKTKIGPFYSILSGVLKVYNCCTWLSIISDLQNVSIHRPQFERFLKDFFNEYERHLAENFHAFCVIL